MFSELNLIYQSTILVLYFFVTLNFISEIVLSSVDLVPGDTILLPATGKTTPPKKYVR